MDEALDESVRAHLVSDVPFGAFLSGGVDSSSVVAHMARALDHPVKTFTIGFEEDHCDESQYARRVAQHLGTEHHELTVRPDAFSLLPELVRHYGEPFAGEEVVIVVQDFGSWREPTGATDRGRGLVLIRALMDSVDIETAPRGTRVTMHRRLTPATSAR